MTVKNSKIEELINFLSDTVVKLNSNKEELDKLIKDDPLGKFKFSSIMDHISNELGRIYSLTHDWERVVREDKYMYEYKCLTCGISGWVERHPTRTIRTPDIISCNEQLILNIIQ